MMESVALYESHLVEEDIDYVMVENDPIESLDDDSYVQCDEIMGLFREESQSICSGICSRLNSFDMDTLMEEGDTSTSIVSLEDIESLQGMLEEKETFLSGDYANSIANPNVCVDSSVSGHVDADRSIDGKSKSAPLKNGSDNRTLADTRENEEDSVADVSTLTAKNSTTSGKTAGVKEDCDTLKLTDSTREKNGMTAAVTATRSRLSNKKRRKQLKLMKKEKASAVAMEALSEMKKEKASLKRTEPVLPHQNKTSASSTSKCKKKSQVSLAVTCATASLAEYRQEHNISPNNGSALNYVALL
eukprot:scaffold4212_cov52-Attheya_sp.AAC.3